MKKLLGCFLCVMLLVFSASFAGATSLDLYQIGASGTVNGALFVVPTVLEQSSSSGTGVINPFVRLHDKNVTGDAAIHNPELIEMGNNTDGTRYYDEKGGIFTHSIKFSDLHQESQGYEFLLDINEEASNPYITLTEMQIWAGPTAEPVDFVDWGSTLGYELLWDLDGAGDSEVNLDYGLWKGSGNSIDLRVYIDLSPTDPNPYIYLWSAFEGTADGHMVPLLTGGYTPIGGPIVGSQTMDDGFNEWCMREPTNSVPEPATMLLLGSGLLGLALFSRQRFK